jgi:hypothetical protein
MVSTNGDRFGAYLLSRGRTPNTARRYGRAFAGFECWCRDEDLSPLAVTSADISRWLADQDGLPAYAVQRRLAALRAYYTYAVITGLRPDDPAKAGRLKLFVPPATANDPDLERLLAEAEAVEDEKEEQPEEVDRPLDMAQVRRIFEQVLDALGASIGMDASVNELLRQAGLFIEVEGWASPGLLERRLRVNSHIAAALVETLRDQGMLREEAPHWLPAGGHRAEQTEHDREARLLAVRLATGKLDAPTWAALFTEYAALRGAPLEEGRRRTSDPNIGQLAEEVGVSPSTAYERLHGRRHPRHRPNAATGAELGRDIRLNNPASTGA